MRKINRKKLKLPSDYDAFTFRPNKKVGKMLASAHDRTKRSKSSLVNESVEIGLRAVLARMGISETEIAAMLPLPDFPGDSSSSREVYQKAYAVPAPAADGKGRENSK